MRMNWSTRGITKKVIVKMHSKHRPKLQAVAQQWLWLHKIVVHNGMNNDAFTCMHVSCLGVKSALAALKAVRRFIALSGAGP
jgi:hypothetical protein